MNDTIILNRELSWIDFNERVLGEGLRTELPPLERLKFLSIVSSNFDEFFMVRVASIKRAMKGGVTADLPGQNLSELLEKITQRVRGIIKRQSDCLFRDILPLLEAGGLCFRSPVHWSPKQKDYLEAFFVREVYPLLTPLRLTPLKPEDAEGENDNDGYSDLLNSRLSLDNYSLYAAFLLEAESGTQTDDDPGTGEFVSVIRIPHSPERLIWLPRETGFTDDILSEITSPVYCVLLEDLIAAWGAAYLFPGYRAKESLIFKVNKDADISVDEKRDEDFVTAMAEVLEHRDSSMPVRMIYTMGSRKLRNILSHRFSLGQDDLFPAKGFLNPGEIFEQISGFDHLKEKPWRASHHPAFSEDETIWDSISQADILLQLPYQSFDPVVRFFQDAASDPQVAAIKTALYRTSGDSPIVHALEQAALSGKHVTAVVELKARFDEVRNISWANRLEKAGVIVVYGIARLKVHAKASIVMRREYNRIKRYVHISTGNYNDKTAKYYEDLSLFTAREDIAYDAGLLFNMITGYSASQSMSRLVIAPTALKRRLLELINREISRSSPEAPGQLIAKMNALADPDIIKALYSASQAGVKIQLIVRGICMLLPGIPGLSENIRVTSIIDYNLEHSRIYYFANGGSDEVYLASADWMPRNLERRVELMFPILQEKLRKNVIEILQAYLKDNSHSWVLNSDGVWKRSMPMPEDEVFRAQSYFHSRAAIALSEEQPGNEWGGGEFIVRRSPQG